MTLPGDSDPLVLAQRYRVTERIGAGSMGAVWKATDELLSRTVAVKQLLLHPGLPGFDARGYEEAKQRILREGRLAARLQHPHTIAVFDVVLHQDAPWLVMEYLPSRTLGALLDDEGPIDPRRAAQIGAQIADGLAAAHAAGIVHRDIKPGNVLIGTDGQVKITDFGVSRAADDVQLTRTGMIAGTPAFLAPEIARGRAPTSAADVFALGSTLYAAVEGLPPFGLDDNAYALLYAVGEGKVSPPTRAGSLTEPLMGMLRKEPEKRPSAAEVRRQLTAVAEGRLVPTPAALPKGGPPASPSVPAPADPPAEPVTAAMGGPAPKREPKPGFRGGAPTRVDLSPLVAGASPPRPGSRPARRSVRDALRARLPAGVFRRKVPLVMALVVLAAVLVGVRVAQSGPTGERSSASGAGTQPAPPGTAATPRIQVSGAPTKTQLESFISGYYRLLPGNPEAAWQLLGPRAQALSQGYDSYTGFYHSLSSIAIVDGPTAVNADTVRALLEFVPKVGAPTRELYSFTVVPGVDHTLTMSSFQH